MFVGMHCLKNRYLVLSIENNRSFDRLRTIWRVHVLYLHIKATPVRNVDYFNLEYGAFESFIKINEFGFNFSM